MCLTSVSWSMKTRPNISYSKRMFVFFTEAGPYFKSLPKLRRQAKTSNIDLAEYVSNNVMLHLC